MARQNLGIPSRADNGQKKFNIAIAMAEKLGIDLTSGFKDQEDVSMPVDVQKMAQAELDGVGAQAEVAHTSNPKRPRAHALGYSTETKTLYIIFRDNTWWEYRNISTAMWSGIKSAPSVGRFLIDSGLNSWSDMGPAELDEMSPGLKARLSLMASISGSIQGA